MRVGLTNFSDVQCICFLPLISDLHLQAREIMDTGTVEIISAPGGVKGK